jgi:hypothetical protein
MDADQAAQKRAAIDKAAQKQLQDELYRQKVRQARSMTPAERVRASFELTDFALNVMAAGVRAQFPAADEHAVQRIVRQRIDRVRRLEEHSRCALKS